jgi:hypothetical protein
VGELGPEHTAHIIASHLNHACTVVGSLVEDQDQVGERQNIEMMRDQDPGLLGKRTVKDAAVEDVVTNVSVDGGKWIVEEHNVALPIIRSSSQANSLSLTSREGDSSLANESAEG